MRFALLMLAGTLPAALSPTLSPVGHRAVGWGHGPWVSAPAVADTILRSVAFQTDTAPTVRIGLARLPLPWPIPNFPIPGSLDPWLDPGGFARLAEARLESLGADPRPFALRGPGPPSGDEGSTAEGLAVDETGSGVELADRLPGTTGLGMRVVGRTELGGDWSRFRPCEQRLRQSCSPTLVPRLEPELRFSVRLGGTISERIHVEVDYDQMREFEAANTINVRYLGGEDAIIRRLDVGDVNFELPASRFLTQGLPAGNFGFQAEGQMGPLDFLAVWAEQKGDLSSREFRLTGVGSERGFVQEDTLVLDDADYVRRQFFFLFDPRELAEYPHVDVLALDPSIASPFMAPGPEPIQLYRFENDPVLRNQVEGFIQADAVAGLGADTVLESGWFRYLQSGLDYFVHPSGLWVALRNPLAPDEMLAVTYVTAAGDTVGTYNPERVHVSGGRPRLQLLKASTAHHQPGRPTWELEMHNIYRVSGSADVEPGTVDLTISLGERSAGRTFARALGGGDISFLRLFGLDEESPLDRIDPAHVYRPARDLFDEQPPVTGTFIVFPTLRPFREPPPLPSLRLSDAETAQILGADANGRIYEAPDPFERDNRGVFRLNIPYRVRSEGLISSFSLGAFGIRDGSERISLGDRLLLRGTDYDIDYDVGQVTLRDAETLFGADPEGAIRATWEQKQIFRTAPTSVAGARATYSFGDRGSLDVVGLYRSEQTLVNRPQLGVEPGAIGLGGLNGRYRADVQWLDRWIERVPGLRSEGGSVMSLGGEVAVSLPNPNTRGDVFLDDFDATSTLPLSLLAHDWKLGSAPESSVGAEALLPGAPAPANAAPLVWQHSWIIQTVNGDSSGVHEGFVPQHEIDRQIRVAGSQIREAGLLITFDGGSGAVGGPPRWRSITTPLSNTGLDLTKTEYLEFYASGGNGLTLVLDLGRVSEDAFFVDLAGSTQGIKLSGVPWGLGLLDQEADPARGEIWSDVTDRLGVWGEDCRTMPQALYPIGNARADCTRANGRRDSEDLDGNGNLELTERHLRYVVELGPASRYLARSRGETGTDFRLYRVPLRGPAAIHVGGTLTEADLRSVKHLRLTMAGTRPGSVTLARMGLIGSRWIKRAGEGVLRGLIGDTLAGGGGRLEVASVSQVTEGQAYNSPPGVREALIDPTLAFGGQGVEFNEKSLGLRFDDLGEGERAEVYQRFPQQPRDFLSYTEARLWVVPRSGDWGPDRDRWFYLKVGTDPENFYLYRTRLGLAANPVEVSEADWLPEVVVDFGQWLDLRRRAEEQLNLTLRRPGDPPVVVWNVDSTYAVVVRDRGRGPDLANVRELAVGVWNESTPFSGGVWVDELRLGGGVKTSGAAAHLDFDLAAADVADLRVTLSSRGAHFRQLEERPSYQTDQLLTLSSSIRLDRFAPATWGVELPLSVSYNHASLDPFYLPDSDVRADRIRGLRRTGSAQTRVSLGFRKRTPSGNPIASVLLDGLDVRLGWYRASAGTITSDVSTKGVDARLGYARRLGVRDFPLVPAFLRPALRALLPGALEDLADARLRWSPERFSFGTAWTRQQGAVARFDRIIAVPLDSLFEPTSTPREVMETAAELRLRPLPSLSADVTLLTGRDLLDPQDAVTDPALRELLAAERSGLPGLDLGWETRRDLRTRIFFRPQILSFLRHDVTWTTRYHSDRNASFLQRREEGADTSLTLTRTADGQRDVRAAVALDLGGLSNAVLGEEARDPLALVFRRLRPVSLVWQDGISARFHRDPVDPGAAFQLGWSDERDFRFVDGDTAAFLADRTVWTLGSGLLAGPLSADLTWSRTRVNTLDTRSDRAVRIDGWPDLRVSLRDLATRWGARMTVGSGVQRSLRETSFGSGGTQTRTDEDIQVPVDLVLTWARDAALSYRGAFRAGLGRDPTGDTERDRSTHRVSFTSSLVGPPWLPLALDRPLRLALVWAYVSELDCRDVVGREGCVAFVDQLNRSLSLSLDTRLAGMDVGVNAGYVNRQSFVGQRSGSTQFQLGLFGQFMFETGELPTRLPL